MTKPKSTTLKKLIQKLYPGKRFTTSSDYWDSRYKRGDGSGAGSYNLFAEFKAEVINDFVKKKQLKSVIEFGCGDGNQLRYFDFESYTGFDISPTVVENCRKLYADDSTKSFETMKVYNGQTADLVLSLDVIYHLIEDAVFSNYMEKLFEASNGYVIIYSSNDEKYEEYNTVQHVKHRKFTDWVKENVSDFTLIQEISNKYPFNGDKNVSSFSDFFIFKKNGDQ